MTTTTRHRYSRPSTHTPRGGAVLTVDPAMAEHLAALHPDLRSAVLTRLPGTGEGALRDCDALLVLGEGDNIYISTDRTDEHLRWRARKLHATRTLQWADPHTTPLLRRLLARHFN